MTMPSTKQKPLADARYCFQRVSSIRSAKLLSPDWLRECLAINQLCVAHLGSSNSIGQSLGPRQPLWLGGPNCSNHISSHRSLGRRGLDSRPSLFIFWRGAAVWTLQAPEAGDSQRYQGGEHLYFASRQTRAGLWGRGVNGVKKTWDATEHQLCVCVSLFM